MEFLKVHQLNLMLMLEGICALLAILTAISKALSPRKKFALMFIEICSVILLIADRSCYFFRGDLSVKGLVLVHAGNFLVYFLLIANIWGYNLYVKDLVTEGDIHPTPKRIKIINILCFVAEGILILSRFFGFIYKIDENNLYQRATGFYVWSVVPFALSLVILTVVIGNRSKISKGTYISLVLFTLAPIVASVVQLFAYGLSLINISMVGTIIILYVFSLLDLNNEVARANQREISILQEEQEHLHREFTQTAEALANAIDAKDKYTHGHSRRVAEYSKKIAQAAGKTEEECEDIYFAALLHDVGKIGVPDNILNKEGRLTEEEFAAIKMHPVIGKQILSTISESVYLSLGAHYHHERYDGKGYPEGLKGEDIPDVARIIGVADAYDAMTSKRSYRETMPQQLVREEFVKGIETQFDPFYAKIILNMIDLDTEYNMREKLSVKELAGKNELVCAEYRSAVSSGIPVAKHFVTVNMKCRPQEGYTAKEALPGIVLFDSLDECIHDADNKSAKMQCYEYGDIRFDGTANCKGVRAKKVEVLPGNKDIAPDEWQLRAVRNRDHIFIRIESAEKNIAITLALPDSTRFTYIGITGEHCIISDIGIKHATTPIDDTFITRIADTINYIDGPQGDIPSIQVETPRSVYSKAFHVGETLTVSFRAKSLPTARLVWHCPYAVLFYSNDATVNGPGYREYALVRADGEGWSDEHCATIKTVIDRLDEFDSWEKWKEKNRAGIDCTITARRMNNILFIQTDVGGISATHTLTLMGKNGDLYMALTGDRCVITNIRINYGNTERLSVKHDEY